MNQRQGHILVAVGLGLLALAGLLGALGAAGAGAHASATGDVAEGLVLHYKFDDTSSPLVVDSSGLGNDGSLFGNAAYTTTTPPLWVPNVFALDLDGVDDYIEAPEPPDTIDLSYRSFSVAFWARRDSLCEPGDGHIVVSQGEESEYQGLHIGFRDNNRFTFAFWDNDLDTPTAYTTSDWHHWACTYNADTHERIIYFDGTAVAADKPSEHYQGNGPLMIGSHLDPAFKFDGLIDEVRVYTRTLGAPEVAALAFKTDTEADTLMALYYSTTGVSWTVKTNWGTDISYCDWYGITCSGEDVSEISLTWNNLSGTIPSELGSLSSLITLSLYANHLTGTIPSELGELSNLTTLSLSYNNHLAGAIPSELGTLGSLTSLSLYLNNHTGTIPPELGKLSSLEYLSLGHNNLSGTIPSELGDLSSLLSLGLEYNDLGGTIPAELGKLTKLERLDLFSNNLTGTIPSELGTLGSLTSLSLFLNDLTGTIPPELGELTRLERLQLYSNNLSGTIPPELGALSNLTTLDLSSNNLLGAVPPELGEMSNLLWLYLGNNGLTGTIPSDLGELSNLIDLELSSNNLHGTIPPELGDLGNLARLYLSGNSLFGAVPPDLGDLSNLNYLHLDANNLSGPIPAELSNLSKLVILWLNANPRLFCWETETALEWATGLFSYQGPDIPCTFLFLPQVLR